MLGNNLGIEVIIVNQNRVPALMELAFLSGKKAENKK